MNLFNTLSQIIIEPDQLDIPTTAATDERVAVILELMFGVLGAVAFLVIVIAGMRFVLSRGNADAAGKARNTIIYAAVGLVVAMLAFAIVRLVVREVA